MLPTNITVEMGDMLRLSLRVDVLVAWRLLQCEHNVPIQYPHVISTSWYQKGGLNGLRQQ